jgi:hypothetical protein
MWSLMQNKNKKYNLQKLLRWFVSLGLLFLLFRQLDYVAFWQSIQNIELSWTFLLFFLFLLNMAVSNLKWQKLLSMLGIKKDFVFLFRIYWVSSFLGKFLPSTVGGDIYRFAVLNVDEAKQQRSQILASILFDRLYGVIGLLFVHFGLFVIVMKRVATYPVFLSIEAGLFGSVLIAGIGTIFAFKHGMHFLLNLKIVANRTFLKRFLDKLGLIYEFWDNQNWREYLLFFMLSVFMAINTLIAWWGAYRAVSAQVDFIWLAYVGSLSAILAMLPVSIDGLGITEVVQVLLLDATGLSVEQVLSVLLLVRSLNILFAASGGVLYLFEDNHA